MTKVVFFDAADTLFYLTHSVGWHYQVVAREFGANLEAPALDAAFRRAWKAAPPRQNAAGPRPDDDKGWWWQLVSQVLDETLPESQSKTFNRSEFFERAYGHFAQPGVWAVYPEVAEVLTHLQERGLRLGVISNFDRRLYPILAELNLRRFFSTIVVSSEVGTDKPAPAIFAHALRAVDCVAGEAMHVGDDPAKDWGASKLGWRVFELNRPQVDLCGVLTALDENDA